VVEAAVLQKVNDLLDHRVAAHDESMVEGHLDKITHAINLCAFYRDFAIIAVWESK
jgi:hypothetical protein